MNSIEKITVSTPSRICLFGEHQDYLGLSVVASAINLRFSAEISPRNDGIINIAIRDKHIDKLNDKNSENSYERFSININKPITYQNNRDYLNSSVNTLLKHGYGLCGADIKMDSTIPIGKGMCSSSTMIVVLIKALLESINSRDKDNEEKIAELAFQAEVAEFNEPGGKMDHYTSAIGGLLHIDFEDGVEIKPIKATLDGCFILFDSLVQKDTTRILAESKIPTIEAINMLAPYGIKSVKDFIKEPNNLELINKLDDFRARKLQANINNYKILLEGLMLLKGDCSPHKLGNLIYEHHKNLRDGLKISTSIIDEIIETSILNGAYGGKINGSGGGGCCYVYASIDNAQKIIEVVGAKGYPAKILLQDNGVRRDN